MHFFGQVYGWSKADVLQLTTQEANYLAAIISDENTWREQRMKRGR